MSKIALICGGASGERGISLNSTRSVMDHLSVFELEIEVFYLNAKHQVFLLSKALVYSNTCEDFDYKLDKSTRLSHQQWVDQLKKCDLVFPLIHGPYGEDGAIQAFLEQNNLPFVGTTSKGCRMMFDKAVANAHLMDLGYEVLESQVYDLNQSPDQLSRLLSQSKVVLKPTKGGSSLGVHVVSTIDEVQSAVDAISLLYDCDILAQSYCDGCEFTVVVIEQNAQPIALMPTEIEVRSNGIYSYQRKYLPSSKTRLHCPARFSKSVIQAIRLRAQVLFKYFNMRDVARLDGWLVGDKIIFSDFNPVSGLEQNSFVFIQASRVGLSHQLILRHIINHAAKRTLQSLKYKDLSQCQQKNIYVLMGGDSSEKQVSLMSGTNVWLKLNTLSHFNVKPYFLDHEHNIWPMQYSHLLNHTVEEVYEQLQQTSSNALSIVNEIRRHLGMKNIRSDGSPISYTLSEFIQTSKDENAMVFLALHGGIGENGTLQANLEEKQVPYNGPNQKTAALAIDKYAFSNWVNAQNIPGVRSLEQKLFERKHDINVTFKQLTKDWSCQKLIAKPRTEGCSKGIKVIKKAQDLSSLSGSIILERFIQTDSIIVKNQNITHQSITGYVELTVVVWEEDSGYSAKPPSLTIAANNYLTEAEKFQGGTGINFTPPPTMLVSEKQVAFIQKKLETIALRLGLRHYARFDLFFNYLTDELIIIEMNSLPALTPSTVLFHQMLACHHQRMPVDVLDSLCKLAI
ncbi:hypothetical protein OAT84_02525 [Gammaproteobacteria bacterium]|nr:hypothetical protein [Gammaproteobacteria bacterium]